MPAATRSDLDKLYAEFLGRAPDEGGAAHFVGKDIEHIRAELAKSDEFRSRQVQSLYQQILGRNADPEGYKHFMDPKWDGGEIKAEMEKSSEFRRRQLEQLYTQTLGRPADPGGLAHFLKEMEGGATLEDVRKGMMRSPEFNASGAVPMMDPAYAAFARKADLEESTIESNTQARRESVNRAMQLQKGRYDMQREDVADRYDRDFESRGMYRAGERLARTAKDQNRVSYDQNLYEHGQREQLSAYETNAAQQLAQSRRQRGEEQIAARGRLTQRATERAYT